MSTKIILICLLLFSIAFVKAQAVYQFKQGLVADSLHKYGREAITIDLLAYNLYTGNLSKPVALQRVCTVGNYSGVWQPIVADTSATFRGAKLANGYLYLTYESTHERIALIHAKGHSMLFINGQPHFGDIYNLGWLYIPIKLKKGSNEILVRCSSIAASQGVSVALLFPEKPLMIQTEDMTLPHIVLDNLLQQPLWGGIVIINTKTQALPSLTITTILEGRELTTIVPVIAPLTTRKVGFRFDVTAVKQKQVYACKVLLKQNGKVVDEKSITLNAVNPDEHYSNTFISDIDGSVQYYSVAPPRASSEQSPALFLSVHGAGVEAIGQARAYKPKDWGVLVAPTNRRPRGFNWEDWGRLDALEVLELARLKFKPDPKRIYLTGHSMGGHGTWFLGATYPDKWAALAPCAGYPTLIGYGSADGKIPTEGKTREEKIIIRASNQSNVIELARNYSGLGVYIHHGDSDKVVSVNYARQMKKVLAEFHKDFSYYEYPGGGHWFGDASVDWPPIFDYFKWHTIALDSTVSKIEFTTANPGVSSRNRWVAILQQQQSLVYSRVALERNRKSKLITGVTENVSILELLLTAFDKGDTILITLDKDKPLQWIKSSSDTIFLYRQGQWHTGLKPNPRHKGANRYGPFKDSFNHHMIFVYGTKGNVQENEWSYNKARYDAESWYYRGNGSIDIIADKNFDPRQYIDRGIILFGNASTNAAWDKLLKHCPIQIARGVAKVGSAQYIGENIGAYFIWPREDSNSASIGVISGTGLSGMRAAEANQYFSGGSGFPDYLLFSTDILKDGAKGIKTAGFYNNEWGIDE